MHNSLHLEQLPSFKGDKPMKNLCIAVALVLTLAVAVSAGHIECGILNPPPPEQATTVTDDALLEVTMTFLQGILSAL
jgi:hypothetical protein